MAKNTGTAQGLNFTTYRCCFFNKLGELEKIGKIETSNPNELVVGSYVVINYVKYNVISSSKNYLGEPLIDLQVA